MAGKEKAIQGKQPCLPRKSEHPQNSYIFRLMEERRKLRRVNMYQNEENKKELTENTIQRETRPLLSLLGPRRMLIIYRATAWLKLCGGRGEDQNV